MKIARLVKISIQRTGDCKNIADRTGDEHRRQQDKCQQDNIHRLFSLQIAFQDSEIHIPTPLPLMAGSYHENY